MNNSTRWRQQQSNDLHGTIFKGLNFLLKFLEIINSKTMTGIPKMTACSRSSKLKYVSGLHR